MEEIWGSREVKGKGGSDVIVFYLKCIKIQN